MAGPMAGAAGMRLWSFSDGISWAR